MTEKLKMVISGGQTGVDQAAWRAAVRLGITTGGWMPKGFLTEEGPRPEFRGRFGAQEHKSKHYSPRTYANVSLADATLWISPDCRWHSDSGGFRCTSNAACKMHKPFHVASYNLRDVEKVAAPLVGVQVLNVAGNRESKFPGIGLSCEGYLFELFRILTGDAHK